MLKECKIYSKSCIVLIHGQTMLQYVLHVCFFMLSLTVRCCYQVSLVIDSRILKICLITM